MASNKDSSGEFRSISGQVETAEPSGGANGNGASARKASTTPPAKPSSSTPSSISSVPTLRKSSSSNLATITASPVSGQSPRGSRNPSPIRQDKPPSLSSTLSTTPSAAAIQRALSASNVPQLQSKGSSVSEAVAKLPGRGQKSATASGETTPSWPVSPRLKSPPPSGPNSRRGSAVAQQRRPDPSAMPSIQVLSATPQSNAPVASKTASADNARPDIQLQAPPKSANRGPSGKSMLETVQESSSDTQEPSAAAVQASKDLKPLTKVTEEETKQLLKRNADKAELEKSAQPNESGSESAGNKSDSTTATNKRGRRTSGASQTQSQHKPSSSKPPQPGTAKARQEGGKQNMTVETETVQSIPQSQLTAADRSNLRADNSGAIKLKPSTETIRPKKKDTKVKSSGRKVTSGTGMYFAAHLPRHQRSDRRSCSTSRAYDALRDLATGQPTSAAFLRSVSIPYTTRVRRAISSIVSSTASSSEDGSVVCESFILSQQLRRAIPSSVLQTLSNQILRKATSKADLFEARVANAVDEANTSDSDETFVYESNPPEQPRRQRHHSRTPSVTSSHSIAEQQRSAIRGFGDQSDDKIRGKRSMKFSRNPYPDYHHHHQDSPDSNHSTIRSHTPTHIGRHGRGGHHTASYDSQDSPYTQASKLRQQHVNHNRSRPNSPKSPQSMQFRSSGGMFSGSKKSESPYDFDTGAHADDERMPLLNGEGYNTTRRNRRQHGHHRFGSSITHSMDEYPMYDEGSRWLCGRRIGACFLTTLVVVLVVVSAVCFVFASNRPLYEVRVHRIQNVLASEQELMLDILVGAVNPNTLGISVGDLDVNIFAKSKHVSKPSKPGNDTEVTATRRLSHRQRAQSSDKRKDEDKNPNPIQDPDGHWHSPGDRDPDDDLENDAQTMLLGRIFHFDQALTFEASPIKQREHVSSGQLRLTKPGNKTESGGSDRWEEVIQYPFELIVRGVLKYQLPISSRLQSVAIGAKTMVHPEEGLDDSGNMKLVPVDESERWQWINWPTLDEDKDASRVKELD